SRNSMENQSFNSEALTPTIERSRKRRRSNEHSAKEGEKAINIQVVVRCRGRIEREIAANSPVIVKTGSREVQVRTNPQDTLPHKNYTFDKVFGPEANQKKLFDTVVVPILNEVRAGYNCTLFAYGQTSTGKTFTMEGKLDTNDGTLGPDAGVIPRSLYNIFETLEEESADFSVRVSYIELYNEELKDLLSSEDDPPKLKILDDNSRKGVLYGHEEVLIQNAAHGIRVLKQGSIKRHMAQTNYNKNSSRSHSVFCITVHIKETMPDGEDLLKVGKFNLVDLAGSENISRTGAENIRAKEAGTINKSLLTLGRCINSLNDHAVHIPYRESKLTRLLQDSLGGRTKTCIVATVSPAKQSYEETLSTLDYAHRAKNILNKPVANQRVTKKALIKEYIGEIERLKADLLAAREKNGVYMAQESYQKLIDENQSRKDENDELRKVNEDLNESVQKLEQENMQVNNKLARYIAIDNHNRKAFQEFHETLLRTTSQFESKLGELNSAHMGFMESMVDQTKEFMENRATEITENLKYIDDRLGQFDKQKESVILLLKNEEKVASNFYQELSRFREESTRDLMQKELEMRANSAAMLEGLRHQLSNQFDKVRLFHDKIEDDLSLLGKTTQSHIESQNRLIGNYRNITQDTTEAEKKFLTEQVQALTKVVEEERSKRMSMQVEFLANIAAYLTNFETSQSAKLEAVEKNISAFDGMISSNTSYLENYEKQYESTKENLAALAKESLPRFVSTVYSIKDSVSSQLDAYKNKIDSTMLSLDALTTTANEEATKLHQQHDQSFKNFAAGVVQSYSDIQGKMVKAQNELKSGAQNVTELKQSNENITNNLHTEVANRIKKSREEITSFKLYREHV
ncbi:1549_t:CDS:10, partial [Acaulospora morrowiae]